MKDEGGPAFPQPSHNGNFVSEYGMGGMTLRDYFAGQALMGFLSLYKMNGPEDQITVSKISYEIADSMLAERTK